MPAIQYRALGWLLIILSLAGCQSMIQQPATTATQTAEKITVQIRPAHGKAKNTQVALQPNTRLQDVIDDSKVKFRNKMAYIVRTSPSTGHSHKLDASFGPNRRVSLETDYAIQPGDRVVIAQDARSSIERVMMDFLGRE